jgi:hypothetical protein
MESIMFATLLKRYLSRTHANLPFLRKDRRGLIEPDA